MGRGVIIALGLLLFVSLGLNIFALGHMSGKMIVGNPPVEAGERGPRGGFEDPFKIMHHADELSPELREKFRASFREELPLLREEHRKMRALRGELGALMSAESWDSAAISAKLDEISAAQERQRGVFNSAFMSAFETLPAAERKRLIDTADERRNKRHKRRHRGGRDDGDDKDDKPRAEREE